MHVQVVRNFLAKYLEFPSGIGLSVTPLFKKDLFSLFEMETIIELRTSRVHTFSNSQRGVEVEDRQKGSGLIKAAILTPFIVLAGVWRRHRAPPRFFPEPRNNSSALIYKHTLALSVSTLPLALNSASDLRSPRQLDAWMGSHSYLPPPLTITHTINLLGKCCPAYITLCAWEIRRAL